jgi:hypothetical protein
VVCVPARRRGVSFVVLDTDVSSASLRGRLADPLQARLTGQTWCISFVTVGELTKWTVLRRGAVVGEGGAGRGGSVLLWCG